MTIIERIIAELEAKQARSAWNKGVKQYAIELVEDLEILLRDGFIAETDLQSPKLLEKAMLNGARDWKQYSEGGGVLFTGCDIACRLCAPWELRKTDYGAKAPNSQETWLDVQTRALYQACRLVKQAALTVMRKERVAS